LPDARENQMSCPFRDRSNSDPVVFRWAHLDSTTVWSPAFRRPARRTCLGPPKGGTPNRAARQRLVVLTRCALFRSHSTLPIEQFGFRLCSAYEETIAPQRSVYAHRTSSCH